jgi:FAD synthetase
LEEFSPSSPGWPPFMRVFPVIEWNYVDVWNFLRVRKFSYCVLYDLGYTSIGNKNNTIRNPYLKKAMSSEYDNDEYHPAYVLTEDNLEREGRTKNAYPTKKVESIPSTAETSEVSSESSNS